MKWKTSLFSALLLSALTVGSTQIVEAQTTNDDNNTPVTTNTDSQTDPVTIVKSGKLGEDVTWNLDSAGTLTISGGTVDQNMIDTDNGPWMVSLNDSDPNSDIVAYAAKKINITGKLILPPNSSAFFCNLQHVSEINGLNNVDTSHVTNFSNMFNYFGWMEYQTYKSLDLSSFDTSNATDMNGMFSRCGVQQLDLSNFKTNKVTDMTDMFIIARVRDLDISNFDTSNLSSTDGVSNDSNIFLNCNLLEHLNLGSAKFDDQTGIDYPDDIDWTDNSGVTYKSSELFDNHPGNWGKVIPDADKDKLKTIDLTVDQQKQTFDIPSSELPKTLGVDVPFKIADPAKKSGYTANPKEIKVYVAINGYTPDDDSPIYALTAYPNQDITFTKNTSSNNNGSSNNNSGSSTNNNGGNSSNSNSSHTTQPTKPAPTFKYSDQYVTVYPNLQWAHLYDTDGTKLANKVLGPNSNWYSNKIMTLDNVKYYQVATNQWVKASDVYVYQKINGVVRTHNQPITYLSTILGDQVSNRGLAKNSDWKTDKIVTIDGQTYYRVSTNEFVNASDVDLI